MPSLPHSGKKRPWKAEKKATPWGKNTEKYHSPEWRRLRKKVLQNNPYCVECVEEGKITLAEVVDHKKPVEQGGEFLDPFNLQGLCHKHHNRKTNLENR